MRLFKQKYFLLSVVILLCYSSNVVFSQAKGSSSVFMIGENDKLYNQIVKDYPIMLLTACKDDIDISFELWNDFLKDLEEFAAKMNFDLKGAKLWINVFWDEKGNIDHIVYYPKPNARNLKYEQLVPIFTEFAKSYQLPLTYKTSYSHYGSANFPIVSRAFIGTNKQ
jgi:hypothetical protein